MKIECLVANVTAVESPDSDRAERAILEGDFGLGVVLANSGCICICRRRAIL